ncbi:MAG: SpoIIE family protein phosphatase [Prevotella sp.]|nr:SpoIIE family protein phosphatase [Prevotella sp.]
MKRLRNFIRQQLSVRLSLWVVFFAALIFIGALSYMFRESRQTVRQEAINRATEILDNTILRVTNILDHVEVAADNFEWLPARHLDAPDSMFVYCRRILINNPNLNGCSIAFEPYFFPDRGRYFSAFSYNDNGEIQTTQEGNSHYEYFYMDWYLLCKLLDRPCWTEPFMDYNPDDIYSKDMIASYCQPMKDKDGKFVGTFSVDLSLSWLSQTISAVKPYPNSYSIMIGRGGTFFVHPDTTKLFYQTIFTETLEHPNQALTDLGHAMQRGEAGMRQLNMDGEDCYVFYKPLADTGWSVAIVCPEDDIFGGFNRLRHVVWIIVLLGLLLLLFIMSRIITKELKPLKKLAGQTKIIAAGQFDKTLPDDGRCDEIGELTHSFGNMQHSLTNYIDELKNTTAQKASMDNELQVAKDIQMSMLPKVYPPYPDRDDIDIYGQLVSAKEVGGDLFDFFIRDEKLFFCIGDVSGKGVPAALVMAVTRAQFRAIAAHEVLPNHIISELNDTMAESNDSNMFVTLFVGVLDLLTGHMRYSNAGHNSPILIGSGVGSLPCDSNIPVGIMSGWKYTAQETSIDPHTTIFLFTDGLTEAEDTRHRLFKEKRIFEVIGKTRNQPKLLIDAMTAAVRDYAGDAQQSDDLTMLAIQYHRIEADIKFQRSLTLPNDVQTVPQLAEFVNIVGEAVGFDTPTAMKMNLAIEEAVVNVMNYAYPAGVRGMVNINAKVSNEWVKFIISDNGTPFDPTVISDVDTTLSAEERPIGGLGIHLVRQIMDSVDYERVENRNVLTLIKKL